MSGGAMVVLAAAAVGCAGSAAWSQAVGYRLDAGSTLTQRYCLPPCACPFREFTGDLTGSFTLTRRAEGPLFTEYALTGLDGSAALNGQPVRVQGYGTYRRGGEVAVMQQLVLYAVVNGTAKVFDSGLTMTDPMHPFPQISIEAQTEVAGCRQDVLTLLAAPDLSVCYANCDGSSEPPVLTVNDFVCFQARFAAGDPYANCDGSTAEPVLNVNDFVCFLTTFASGCP